MNKRLIVLLLLISSFITPMVMAEEDVLIETTSPEVSDTNNIQDFNAEETQNSFTYKNDKTGYTAIIEDEASLLSDEEKTKLLEKMISLTEFGHIGFVSTLNNHDSTSNYSSSYYHSHFGTASGSIFVIDMDNRQIYIFSDGNNYKNISSAKAYTITDNTYKYASNEDYYNCAYYSYEQMYAVLNGQRIAEPMRLSSNIFISLTLSFFISFLIVLSQTKIKKASVSNIVKNCDISFEIGETSAQKTGSHRVYSPVSDGGSSSGGGGGGGSSGGGGGHSF